MPYSCRLRVVQSDSKGVCIDSKSREGLAYLITDVEDQAQRSEYYIN